MTDDGHKEIYFQLGEAKKQIAELDKQIALMAQSTGHIVEGVQRVADAMAKHMASHEKNRSTLKSSAITFAFNLLTMGIAGGAGAVVAMLANG